MSSSQPKITSATCPKCKQGFKFKRLPKMAAIVCPHCSAKIRLTRKASKTGPAEQPTSDSKTKSNKPREANPTPSKPARAVVPELPDDKTKTAGAIQNDSQAGDLSNLETSRKRQPASLNELEIGESSAPELSELEAEDDFPNIRTGRKRARFDLDQLDDVDSEPANLADLESQDQPLDSSEISSSETDAVVSKGNDRETDDAIQAKSNLANELLPPKFLVPDIEADENAVILPTAGGGLQVVDKTEVRVMHEGRSVKLVSLSRDELKRVRLIENLVALLIAGIMLAIAVWLVL